MPHSLLNPPKIGFLQNRTIILWVIFHDLKPCSYHTLLLDRLSQISLLLCNYLVILLALFSKYQLLACLCSCWKQVLVISLNILLILEIGGSGEIIKLEDFFYNFVIGVSQGLCGEQNIEIYLLFTKYIESLREGLKKNRVKLHIWVGGWFRIGTNSTKRQAFKIHFRPF